MTQTAKLHAIIDPLCGWCYAAAPLLAAAATAGFTITLHAGGMLTGTRRRQIDAAWRDYVIPQDLRIAELSGQPFGAAYFDGLLRDTSILLDSAPPSIAMLAVAAMGGDSLAFLHRVQLAHYRDGHSASDKAGLTALAQAQGLASDSFLAHYALSAAGLTSHLEASRALLRHLGAQGFPTIAMEQANGDLQQLNINRFYGQADAWVAYLQSRYATMHP
ncbi:DsbA family protein [Shewanella sp. AS16]|uniref:DsbA family protein n=1 Tax=Shewanella sp. AS16 TaxID=2907625 RepID=UPI001F488FE9|nr:DsbA family protein [Shewanella sp. AS16]MCE9685358.1 DsbA family protein [Shewanella sp. AS16]